MVCWTFVLFFHSQSQDNRYGLLDLKQPINQSINSSSSYYDYYYHDCSLCRQLKKAYFRQLEEIRSLKEQVTLKDKRIRLLESELSTLKEKESTLGPGESNC